MEMEASIDFGGVKLSSQDILTDDVICKIKNLNPKLGTQDDPYYERYKQYRDEFANAELIIIDANALNKSSMSNLNLSGNEEISDLPSNFFQLVADTLTIAFGKDEFRFAGETRNIYPGFENYTAFGDTEYSSLSDGNYM